MELHANPLQIDFDYSDAPTILKFANCDKRVRGLMGPFGSGKSTACLIEIIRRAHMQRPSTSDGIRKFRVVVVRNTFPQLRDTTLKTVLDWLPPRYFGELRVADHEYIVTGFPGVRIEMLFRALDKPDHVANLLSLELTMAWINEAREIPQAIFNAVDGRINRYPSKREGGITWTGIIMDTNPPDEDSWWYKYFEEISPDNAAIFKQPSGLSPHAENTKNLPDNYYRELMVGKPKDFVQVYIEGKYGYVKEGRPVYTNWNETLHVATDEIRPVPGRPLILGFDFGLSPAAVICQQTVRGHFHVLDELVSEGMGIRSFAKNVVKPLLATKYRGFPIIGSGDPAGVAKSQADERTCYEELKAQGLKITPAETNKNVARIGAVEALLGQIIDGKPVFQLSPQCRWLRKGFNGGYKFVRLQTNSERYADKPVKNDLSHIQDALQYAAMYVDKKVRLDRGGKLIRFPKRYVSPTTAGY